MRAPEIECGSVCFRLAVPAQAVQYEGQPGFGVDAVSPELAGRNSDSPRSIRKFRVAVVALTSHIPNFNITLVGVLLFLLPVTTQGQALALFRIHSFLVRMPEAAGLTSPQGLFLRLCRLEMRSFPAGRRLLPCILSFRVIVLFHTKARIRPHPGTLRLHVLSIPEVCQWRAVTGRRLQARDNRDTLDWDSLRRWIVVSDLPVRDEVLSVIDEVSDPDARDAAIWKIDNGKTYLRLLHEVYPQLRRVDYRVEYLLPAFTTEQSRRLIESGPGQLSLAEMCRLAASYPEDSPERASVCAVASAYYPDDPCACNNSAMLALRQGDTQTARHYLSRCADDPRSLNNLGVLCLMEGDREKARHCFGLAADSGSADAAYNLAHFDELSYEDFGQRSSENLL